jgi:uncharacterized protein YndB with AHSA1/START domain
MVNKLSKPIGQTKDVSFQIGLRKTFPVSIETAWNYLISPEGVRVWLGESADFRLDKGVLYRTLDGISGEVRVVNPRENIRLTWQPKGWLKPSTIQVRVISKETRTTLSFHQENLPDAEAREIMRTRWKRVLTSVEKDLSA